MTREVGTVEGGRAWVEVEGLQMVSGARHVALGKKDAKVGESES